MKQPSDCDVDQTVEKLKRKYTERRRQLPPSEESTLGPNHTHRDEPVQRPTLTPRSKQLSKEVKGYNQALHELFRAITNPPDRLGSDFSLRGSNEDLVGACTAVPHSDSQVLFTETDVTLPSSLDGTLCSQDTEGDRELWRVRQLSSPSPSSASHASSSLLGKVYREMMTIYQQLKAERSGQQQWEKELQERERRLQQQEEALGRLTGLEEMVHTRILAVKEKHQQEVSQLQDLLRERSKENRRLKSSFDTIKELNDNMKKQLNAIIEQNKKLESQSKRVQARLDNLQRKYEHSTAMRGCQNVCVKSTECVRPSKQEKSAAPGKTIKKGSPVSPKLLALLLDWILDGQMFSSVAGNKEKDIGQCLPPDILRNERCLKVLPLLADQLHQTSSSESDLILNLLRLIHWALKQMDSSAQHVALSSTLRRIGEEVSKLTSQSTVCESDDLDVLPKSRGGGRVEHLRNWPLYLSPCLHTRILASLIILRTVTQADVLAQALNSLHSELMCEESRGLFIHYDGVCALLSMLRAGRGGLHTPVDILVLLTEQSRFLAPFLEACSSEEFFHTASQLLKKPRLELPLLEKFSILLQKLSSIRKNRRLFELSSLHLQIQELHHKTNHTNTFLSLNLRAWVGG
ncbi:coiled-coil domain-containing protein 138 isoform X2 [Myripristis murdjan]|uniref:Coiled-coil domain containing 138 n=1 Tax=Myripristis murdjan TaxID=586833 RepID=A0A667Z4K1_9TELE|nr:coiled-coil domain-containing protein 138 isoform X2 [Myripristis murdjan]